MVRFWFFWYNLQIPYYANLIVVFQQHSATNLTLEGSYYSWNWKQYTKHTMYQKPNSECLQNVTNPMQPILQSYYQ